MFVLAKRNIVIPSPAPGIAPVVLKKDGFATVPDWAAETTYFKALAADGKIVATDHRDKDIQTAAEKPVKTRRAKAEEKPAEPAAAGKENGMIYGAQFGGVRQQAANLGGSVGNYTAEQFKEEYPQFCNADGKCHLPDALLNEIVRMANVSVQPDKWLYSWHYAVGLYVAHYVTLQLRTFAESSATPAQAAASGALVGVVKSATLGDSSVTYDTSALTAGTEDWGDLNATTYGQMLANRARFIGLAGSYVI